MTSTAEYGISKDYFHGGKHARGPARERGETMTETSWVQQMFSRGLLVVAALSLSACGDSAEIAASRTITTVGSASVAIAPDVVNIIVGVATDGETAATALSENAQIMTSVNEAIEELGVEANDVQTNQIAVTPLYETVVDDEGRRSQKLVGYRASNRVRIAMRDVGGVGEALDALAEAGSTTISGLSFDVSDPEAALDQARRDAIADARRKAEQMAEETDVDLGDVVSIAEREAGAGGPSFAPSTRALSEATPIAPGETEVAASVVVVWSID